MQLKYLKVHELDSLRGVFSSLTFLSFASTAPTMGLLFGTGKSVNMKSKIKYKICLISFKYMYETFTVIVYIKLEKIKQFYSLGLPSVQGQFRSLLSAVYSSTLSFHSARVLCEHFFADVCSMVCRMHFPDCKTF